MPIPPFAPRRDDEAPVDLTTHAVVHRAIRMDVRRLAAVVGALADEKLPCTQARAEALHEYFGCMAHYIRTHQRLAKDVVLPLLIAMETGQSRLPALGIHDGTFAELLERAGALMAELAASPTQPGVTRALAGTLDPLKDRLEHHIAHEEAAVFPLILSHLTAESLSWVEGQFERGLKPQLLPFIVPWIVSHATEDERTLMAARAKMPMRAILKTFESSFIETQQTAFGD